jgi:hypothetical protein
MAIALVAFGPLQQTLYTVALLWLFFKVIPTLYL